MSYLHQIGKVFDFSIAQFHYPESQELVLCLSQNIICLQSFSIHVKVKWKFKATLCDDKLFTTTKEKWKERLHVLPRGIERKPCGLADEKKKITS